jgi:[ribosomal protein S5]-alanine N-acetyltransferase
MFATTLTTERLVLRPPRVEDAAANFERYTSDPEVTRYMSWKTNTAVDESAAFLRSITDPESPPSDQHWAICFEGDPLPCGMITVFGSGQLVALGYVLRRSLWGQGVMPEAVRAVAAEVWRDERTWRLQALAHVDNVASQRVMEKCGLRREGVLRRRFVMPQIGDEPQDCALYAQVRDDVR